MVLLTIASVLLLGLDFAFEPTGRVLLALHVGDYLILAVFAFDYFGRLWLTEPEFPSAIRLRWIDVVFYHFMARLRFVLKPANLIDLVSILPLISYFRALRILRILRLIQMLRVLPVNPFEVLEAAIRRNALLYASTFAFVGIAVSVASVLVFVAEHRVNPAFKHFGNAVWWAVVTVTTVGFGDVVPLTAGGKLVGILLMFGGMFLIALFAGVISQTLVSQLLVLREERVRMSGLVDQIVICGWNRNGPLLLEELALRYACRLSRIVVFANEDPPEGFDARFTFVKGDPTKESECDKVRMDVATSVLIIADNPERDPSASDAKTVLTAFAIRSYERKLSERGIVRRQPLHISAEVIDSQNAAILQTAGVDEIIQSARLSCSLLAHSAGAPETGQVFYDLLTHPDQQLTRIPLTIPADGSNRFFEIGSAFKRREEALAIGLVRKGALMLNPPADTLVQEGDELLVLHQAIAMEAKAVEKGLFKRIMPRLRR
ncbi:Cyclic nucleotide-gated potassium channel [compost metagenome]